MKRRFGMYATVRVYTASPELTDALVAREDEVKQVVGGIEGFKAYYLIRTADGTASVSVYESQEGAAESNRAAAAWIRENLPDLSVAPPQVSEGEVAIHG